MAQASDDGPQARTGAVDDALATVEQALQGNPDALVFRPENLRLRGSLRLAQGQTELAAADFREAIALAQQMGAKTFELRATMSLARLRAQQGQRDEARTMLAEIYNWFTEGFDTADLKEAKALLEDLRWWVPGPRRCAGWWRRWGDELAHTFAMHR